MSWAHKSVFGISFESPIPERGTVFLKKGVVMQMRYKRRFQKDVKGAVNFMDML
ncbi:hypothetical protein ABH944_008360 [Caballeronia udeis]|uniref:Uncharacterized protein n=1 Tax=Caballeronia udeis TaxID=1232866 RepID=A0ABW8N354_9BURK